MNRSKNNFVILLVILMLCITKLFAQVQNSSAADDDEKNSENKIVVPNSETIYQCQIHPKILSGTDGFCPRCELQYELRTLEAAFSILNDKGVYKPTLSLNYITKVEVEEEEVTADSAVVTDSLGTIDAAAILAEYDFEEMDHDGDGMLWQCPNHLEEIYDDEDLCMVCLTECGYLSIDNIKSQLVKMMQTENPDSEEVNAGSLENNP